MYACKNDFDPCCQDLPEDSENDFRTRLLRTTLAYGHPEHADALKLTGAWWDEYKVGWAAGRQGRWVIDRYTNDDWLTPSAYGTDPVLNTVLGRWVPPGTWTRLMERWELGMRTWMTDTPAEVIDHIDFYDRAHGRVLINGLGLGMSLKYVANKPCVTHVDVVEIEEDLIRLIGRQFKRHPRVTIHQADAYTFDVPGATWDVVWHDIWAGIGDSDHLDGMEQLEQKYEKRCTWQGSWAKGVALLGT